MKNVLHFQITMKKWRAKVMHGSNTFTDIYKNMEDLCFGETFA